MDTGITSKDIEALQEYLDKLEALDNETPEGVLTSEEWDEAMKAIQETGEIPAKYAGRIAEKEIIVHSDIVDGEYKTFPEGRKRKAYHDIAKEAHYEKYARLKEEYQDSIIKLFESYLSGEHGEEASLNFAQTLKVVAERIEEEAKKAKTGILPPLGSAPNGEPINFLLRTLAGTKGGRTPEQWKSKTTRGETVHLQKTKKGDTLKYTRQNKGDSIVIEIAQADKYLKKTNKTFAKVLLFTLQKMNAQNFPPEVVFSLQELVDLGMYSTTSNAGRAVKDFFAQQSQTILSGTVKHGKKTIKEEGGILFYHYALDKGHGFISLSVNPNFNMNFIANYFTVFPRFAYALSNNAFSLVRYIFYLARQNTKAIKEKGTFNISLEAVRENLGLPSVEEVKQRRYRQQIMEPIEKAIEEIEEALENVPEAKEYGFTITPRGTGTSNIRQWLTGYLEIGLKGDFAETFVRIASKAESDRKRWETAKQAELARIAARKELKEARAENQE